MCTYKRGIQVSCEDVCGDVFQTLVQTRHCDRIRKSLIRPDLFTLFTDKTTHLLVKPYHHPTHTHLLALC